MALRNKIPSEYVSNSLDPVQARGPVGPDLGPNCLQRLSATTLERGHTHGERKSKIIMI